MAVSEEIERDVPVREGVYGERVAAVEPGGIEYIADKERHGQYGAKSASIDKPPQQQVADDASDPKHGSGEHGLRGRVTGTGHHDGQPVCQKIGAQQVHEVNDPQKDGRGGAAFLE